MGKKWNKYISTEESYVLLYGNIETPPGTLSCFHVNEHIRKSYRKLFYSFLDLKLLLKRSRCENGNKIVEISIPILRLECAHHAKVPAT